MRKLLALAVFSVVNGVSQDPLAVDSRHYKVDLENEWVRVLRVHYEPGEGSPMHEHTAGVRVFLTDIRNRFTNSDGSTSDAARSAGDIIWAEKVRHANTILSPSSVEMIELELKQPLRGPARPLPSTASPDPLEKVIIENEYVRVLRAVVPGGRETRRHEHPNSVLISIRPRKSAIPEAVVSWLPGGSHTLQNGAGEGALEAVLIELKPPPTP